MVKDYRPTIGDFVYVNARSWTGVDIDGVIAVPTSEFREKISANEREPGWLDKQFAEARRRVSEWPQWKKDAEEKERQRS